MKKDCLDSPTERDKLGEWLNTKGLVGSGVEVGCMSGVYSKLVLDAWRGKKMYLVDTWETQPIHIYREDDGRINYKDSFERAETLALSDPRVELVKGLSSDVVHGFSNATQDFVYIDANHAYENVIEDMTLWWDKVVPGGILCGHDFYNCTTHPFYNEVERAVEDWSRERGIDFCVTTKCSSWWMPK